MGSPVKRIPKITNTSLNSGRTRNNRNTVENNRTSTSNKIYDVHDLDELYEDARRNLEQFQRVKSK